MPPLLRGRRAPLRRAPGWPSATRRSARSSKRGPRRSSRDAGHHCAGRVVLGCRRLRRTIRACRPAPRVGGDVRGDRRPRRADIPAPRTLADLDADPIGPNAELGTYTNFVNLLDLCALAVPGECAPTACPPGVTLIAPACGDARLASLGAALHRAAGVKLGATGAPLPAASGARGPRERRGDRTRRRRRSSFRPAAQPRALAPAALPARRRDEARLSPVRAAGRTARASGSPARRNPAARRCHRDGGLGARAGCLRRFRRRRSRRRSRSARCASPTAPIRRASSSNRRQRPAPPTSRPTAAGGPSTAGSPE